MEGHLRVAATSRCSPFGCMTRAIDALAGRSPTCVPRRCRTPSRRSPSRVTQAAGLRGERRPWPRAASSGTPPKKKLARPAQDGAGRVEPNRSLPRAAERSFRPLYQLSPNFRVPATEHNSLVCGRIPPPVEPVAEVLTPRGRGARGRVPQVPRREVRVALELACFVKPA